MKRILFLFLLLCSFGLGIAQDQARPKIAVVLSGGGAKGMAHVGFLKVMEEAGIKPDIIVGTSMGSIVGGLYSLGYSASELDSMCRTANWDRLLSNKTPLYDINFENKYFEDRLEFDGFPIVKGKLKLPSGIIEGQYLQEFFDSLVFEKKSYHNFLEFPIAYTAVACNIENGQAVYLDTGNFTKAIRASMAIPSVFAPVRINASYHVDGGVVDNFPVQRAVQMGADIVIGVNVGGGFETGESVNSAVGSLMQTAFIVSYSKLPEDMKHVDLYIEPDLHGYGTGSFGAADSIIKYGYEAAIPYLDTLKIIAKHSRQEIIPLKDVDAYKINEITFKSIKPLGSELEKLILGKLDVQVGDTIFKEHFFAGMKQLRSTQLLNNVFFALNKQGDGYELELQIIQKEKITLGVSVNYNVYQSFGLVIGVTGRNALFQADRMKLLGRISESPKIEFNYLKYIGPKRGVGLSTNVLYSFNQIPSFVDGNKSSVFNYHFLDAGIFFNTTKSSKQGLALGFDYMLNTATGSVVADTNLQKIKKSQAQFVFARLGYQFNTLNAREFPTDGMMFSGVFSQNIWNGVKLNPSDEEIADTIFPQLEKDMELTDGYQKIELDYLHFLKLAKRWSLILGANVSAIFSRKVGAIDRDYIGGFMRVVPYQAVFWGLNFAKGGSVYNYASPKIGLRVNAFPNFYITAMFNYMTYLDTEQRFYWNTIFTEKLYTYNLYGGGIEFAYNTRVGPLRLGAGYGTGNKNVSLFVSAGFNL